MFTVVSCAQSYYIKHQCMAFHARPNYQMKSEVQMQNIKFKCQMHAEVSNTKYTRFYVSSANADVAVKCRLQIKCTWKKFQRESQKCNGYIKQWFTCDVISLITNFLSRRYKAFKHMFCSSSTFNCRWKV